MKIMLAGNFQIETMRQVIEHSRKWTHPLNIRQLLADGFKARKIKEVSKSKTWR